MVPMVEGRMTLKSMLADQEQFVGQAAKFKKFNQEAGAIESHISSCKRLLPEFNQRPNEEVSTYSPVLNVTWCGLNLHYTDVNDKDIARN